MRNNECIHLPSENNTKEIIVENGSAINHLSEKLNFAVFKLHLMQHRSHSSFLL